MIAANHLTHTNPGAAGSAPRGPSKKEKASVLSAQAGPDGIGILKELSSVVSMMQRDLYN